MIYFNIVEKTVNTDLFNQVTVNAIKWVVNSIPRGADTAIVNCTLIYVHPDGTIDDLLYSYNIYIPNTVLDQWLDDSVIDDFIIAESNGLFVKQ